MARPHPTPQKHDSPNANPNGTAQQSADLTKRCACAAKCITSRCEAARRAFRMRLPPKVTRQVSKTSISYETSSKSHTSSLQNERFARDFLKKSHVKSPKRAFRTRLPQKVTRQVSKTSVSYETSSKTHTSKSANRAFRTRLPPKVKRNPPSRSTHITQACQAVSRFQPLQTTSAHTPIPM